MYLTITSHYTDNLSVQGAFRDKQGGGVIQLWNSLQIHTIIIINFNAWLKTIYAFI